MAEPRSCGLETCKMLLPIALMYIITAEVKARLQEGLPPFHEIRLFQGERDALFLAFFGALLGEGSRATTARRDTAMTPRWTNTQSQDAHLLTGYILWSTWLWSCAAVAAMMMMCFLFQKRVPCTPGTLPQPPERRARRTTWASAPRKRNARSLCAHAPVPLEARRANPMRGTRHCIK